jgi:phosphoribosylaminoimidazole-succinocarboxamide synthase
MVRRRRIYEGKAKILYEGPEPGTLIQYFKDDATAFNNQKRGVIEGKGVLNNRISTSSAGSTCASSSCARSRSSRSRW